MNQPGAIRRLLVPGLFTLVALVILIALGVWQVQRLHWKEALIARVTARLDAPPVPAPAPDAWASLDLSDLEYQPVTVSGHYRNADEVHVVYTLTSPHGPVGGLGYLVMTPFETDGGWLVYVNRGFVPRERTYAQSRPEGQIEGETTVVGLLRQPAKSSWFSPGDDISDNSWFSRDPDAYARAYGLPPANVAPYIIDARYDPALPGGLPQGGETVVSFPNNHLQYAVTWFGLAAALLGVFVAFAWGRLKR